MARHLDEEAAVDRKLLVDDDDHFQIPPPKGPAITIIEDGKVEEVVNPPLSKFGFFLVFIGLLLAIFLAALDQLIIGTALPALAEEFNGLSQISWVGTSYLMTASASTPVYGKMSDIFGRKPTFLFAIITFEIGSLICAVSVNMIMLIVGRAIAGVGLGGVFTMVLLIIAELVSMQERSKYQGLIGAVYGLSSVLGPIAGGLFTEHVSWRWCFYINLPIGAITVLVVSLFLHLKSPEGSVMAKLRRVDFLGIIILILAVIAFVTAVQGGGTSFAWNSATSIALFVVCGLLVILFFIVELNVAPEPIVPAAMFSNRSVYAGLALAFFLGSAFFGLIYYVSVYFQVVSGDTPLMSGLHQLPGSAGVVAFSIISGLVVSKTGQYVPFSIFGGCVAVIGTVFCSLWTLDTSTTVEYVGLFVFGVGIGSNIQVRVVAVQNAVEPRFIGVATALSTFFQTLGGAVGVAVLGAVFNNSLSSNLANLLPSAIVSLVIEQPTLIRTLVSADLQPAALQAFNSSITLAWKGWHTAICRLHQANVFECQTLISLSLGSLGLGFVHKQDANQLTNKNNCKQHGNMYNNLSASSS
ncbi:hypothetical protein SmJEL517_g00180 [Synchytrium microbalum]|uniref:Major facilitator superfamily (MFS) profile domain-containing protein n=1 Tax=Synchytrium microbalum TaxID=1806994 RepID=A0A507CJ20_9FUNG|nr:uncharacterized protein SmJEL517_g00180 [Synchytrium microbalum]TPX38174.1 hypothetical protein SmJEL517_g00180 [Synchytrium microbalum]